MLPEGLAAHAVGRAGAVLVLAAMLALLLRPLPRPAAAALVAAAAALVVTVRVNGLTLADYAFSGTGPLAAAGFVMLGSQLWRHLVRTPLAISGWGVPAFAATLAVLGVAFYPPALGLGSFDPYALGYAGWAIPGLMAGLALLGLVLHSPAILAWVAVAGGLFLAGLTGSRNLWDALLDPVGWIAALVLLAELTIARRRRSPRPPPARG